MLPLEKQGLEFYPQRLRTPHCLASLLADTRIKVVREGMKPKDTFYTNANYIYAVELHI